MGFGDGSVGGYILSFRKVGLLSGDFAVKLLKGANPNSLRLTEDDYYEYVFDWRELKRWNIHNTATLPGGSSVLFKEINPFEEYKWIIGAGLLFIVIQSILIGNLIRLNRNQKLMTNKIIESENKYREFLHQDRILRLGQLTASLSHELNQPLTAIMSTAQAGIRFIDSNDYTPELLKQILQKIVENDKRTASILSSIRGMLKFEHREKENVDLNSVVTDVIKVFLSEASKRGITLTLSLPSEDIFVLADPVQIQQVLLNFLLNAAQSIERTNHRKREITVKQSVNNETVQVSVSDTGKGIDESIKEKIFKPFISSKTEGIGIGLAICNSIIEDHSGKISAGNIPGGGAEFSFSLNILKNG
jgi:signal transduction histidine kinase